MIRIVKLRYRAVGQIYFSRFIIQPYLDDPKHSRYIDATVLDRYWDVGGVRLEGFSVFFNLSSALINSLISFIDNILIMEDGPENLTMSSSASSSTTAVKDIETIEKIIREEVEKYTKE
jgi:Xaa-Pro dipeptidase